MKIIHIVENLDKGAVENWLVRMFIESRKIYPHWQWTFYCIVAKEGRLDGDVRNAGGEIIYSPVPLSRKWGFLKQLRSVLKIRQFDIIHSHHDYLSGFYLLASHGLRFKKRILHIHNTDKVLPTRSIILYKFLLEPFRRLAIWYSDIVLGISCNALQEFVRESKSGGRRFEVLYYGINVDSFKNPVNRELLRRELNIPAYGKIILFIGRMNPIKNPLFVVDILAGLLKSRSDIWAVFVGEGDLKQEIVTKATTFGVKDNIRMVGWRDDIISIMKSCDVFLFPRLEYPKEGFGLVVIEAQAAGLPSILSKGIVEDTVVIEELVSFLSSSNNLEEWLEETARILNNRPVISQDMAFNRMSESHFELTRATQNILKLYCE